MTDAISQPTAEGNLSDTPFAHLVLYLYQHRSSGTLVVTLPDRAEPVKVLFQRGRGIAARLPEPAAGISEGLLPLCELSQAPFAFYETDLVGEGGDVVTGMFDPHAFVAESVRSHPRNDAIEGVLARFGESPLRWQPGADVSRLRLTAQESKLVDILRAEPVSVAQLCAQTELPEQTARRLIYALIVTKLIAPYERSERSDDGARESRSTSPSGPPEPRNSAQPRAPSSSGTVSAQPSAGSAWQNIAARAASAASLRPGAAVASLRPPGGVSPTSITFKSTPATPRPSMAAPELLDLPSKVKRVEQLLPRRAYDEALPLIRAVCVEAPNEAKHQGLLALVMFSRSSEDTAVAKEVVDAVNLALRLNEDEPNALYTKALCYKRVGKDREAMHYFKRTVAVDSTNIDAARELRLYTLRGTEESKKTKR